MPTSTENASFQPGLSNKKRPTCLGQLEAQLKKLVGAFPITVDFMKSGGFHVKSRDMHSMKLKTLSRII